MNSSYNLQILSLSSVYGKVFIYDTAGKQIARSKSTNINVSKLKEGVYVLKAGTQLVKFVKH